MGNQQLPPERRLDPRVPKPKLVVYKPQTASVDRDITHAINVEVRFHSAVRIAVAAEPHYMRQDAGGPHSVARANPLKGIEAAHSRAEVLAPAITNGIARGRANGQIFKREEAGAIVVEDPGSTPGEDGLRTPARKAATPPTWPWAFTPDAGRNQAKSEFQMDLSSRGAANDAPPDTSSVT